MQWSYISISLLAAISQALLTYLRNICLTPSFQVIYNYRFLINWFSRTFNFLFRFFFVLSTLFFNVLHGDFSFCLVSVFFSEWTPSTDQRYYRAEPRSIISLQSWAFSWRGFSRTFNFLFIFLAVCLPPGVHHRVFASSPDSRCSWQVLSWLRGFFHVLLTFFSFNSSDLSCHEPWERWWMFSSLLWLVVFPCEVAGQRGECIVGSDFMPCTGLSLFLV